MVGNREQPTRDGVAGGLRTRTEQQAEEQVQLEVGQCVGVQCRVRDDRQHVVGRLPPASTRSAPGRRCTSACRPLPASSARPTPYASRRSRTAARWLRTANVVPTQALPAGCRSSASAARRRCRRGSRTAPPATTASSRRRALARRSSSTRRIIRGVSPELTSRRICECRGSSIMLSTWPATARSCSSVPPYGRVAAGHRRVGLRITQHGKRFGICGNRPEALAVGRVLGRFVPVHRRLAAVHLEQVMREACGEVVQIGEVDPGQRPRQCHRIAPEVYFAASG